MGTLMVTHKQASNFFLFRKITLKSFERSDALFPFIQKKEDRRYHVTCKPFRLHMVQRFK